MLLSLQATLQPLQGATKPRCFKEELAHPSTLNSRMSRPPVDADDGKSLFIGRSLLAHGPKVLVQIAGPFEEPSLLQPGESIVLRYPLPLLGSVGGLGELEHHLHPLVLSQLGWELPSRPCRRQGAAFHMKRKRKGLAGCSPAINNRDSCLVLAQPELLGCSKSRLSCSANISSEVSKPQAFPAQAGSAVGK